MLNAPDYQNASSDKQPIKDNETQASDGSTNVAEDNSNQTKENLFINDTKNSEDTKKQIRNPLSRND